MRLNLRSLGGAAGDLVNSTGYPDSEKLMRAREKRYPIMSIIIAENELTTSIIVTDLTQFDST